MRCQHSEWAQDERTVLYKKSTTTTSAFKLHTPCCAQEFPPPTLLLKVVSIITLIIHCDFCAFLCQRPLHTPAAHRSSPPPTFLVKVVSIISLIILQVGVWFLCVSMPTTVRPSPLRWRSWDLNRQWPKRAFQQRENYASWHFISNTPPPPPPKWPWPRFPMGQCDPPYDLDLISYGSLWSPSPYDLDLDFLTVTPVGQCGHQISQRQAPSKPPNLF